MKTQLSTQMVGLDLNTDTDQRDKETLNQKVDLEYSLNKI
jgi:hypothetical protein